MRIFEMWALVGQCRRDSLPRLHARNYISMSQSNFSVLVPFEKPYVSSVDLDRAHIYNLISRPVALCRVFYSLSRARNHTSREIFNKEA
jgi:hypothetical protein